MDDVWFIFQGEKGQMFSTLGDMNVNIELEIAITTQTPPHVSWEYKLDCVVHKFISLIYTTVFDMVLFFWPH